MSFEANWAKIDYDEVTFGRTESERQGYFLSGYWDVSARVKLNAFGSWEDTKYPSNHRYIGTVSSGSGTAPNDSPPGYCTTTNPNCYDPFAPPNPNNSYNWNSETKDKTWMVGVGADWQATDALKLTRSFLYVDNEGTATFGVQNNIALSPMPLPINNFDNSKQAFFNLKGTYSLNRNWSFTGGYSYLKYTHNDIATDGYAYVLPLVRNTGAGGILPSLNEQHFAELPQRLRRVHRRSLEHLLPAGDLQVRRAAAAAGTADGGASAGPGAGRDAAAAPAAPAAAAGARTGAEDHARREGAVRLRQGGAEARRQGGDRQPGGQPSSRRSRSSSWSSCRATPTGSAATPTTRSSRRRARTAVRDYLVSKGVDKAKIETIGMGEKQPVVQCDQKNMKELIACLQPNRRVDVEVRGEGRK